jgi:hypothetical protein
MFSTPVLVDPNLYRRYNITEVPAVVFAEGVNFLEGQEGMGSEGLGHVSSVGKASIVYGDMALDAVLERINKETKSDSLKAYIAALRKGFY